MTKEFKGTMLEGDVYKYYREFRRGVFIDGRGNHRFNGNHRDIRAR